MMAIAATVSGSGGGIAEFGAQCKAKRQAKRRSLNLAYVGMMRLKN
jgi:hypothetical protein